MPTNGLAPPDMPWLFTRPGQPNGLGPPLLNYAAPPDAGGQTLGSAVADTGANAWQWLQDQRAESTRQGLLDPETGLPTQKGIVDAARATAEGVMMGTTAPGIRAYHGSPHSFEAFDTSKIGTGEGAQAYGHGLYFAEGEGVARQYRDQLSRTTGPQADALNSAYQDFQNNLQELWDLKRKGQPVPQELADRIDASQTKYSDLHATAGHMYEVNIGADPEHFLHWDKPLSEQSQHVQEAVKRVGAVPDPLEVNTAGHFGYSLNEFKTLTPEYQQELIAKLPANHANYARDPRGSEIYGDTPGRRSDPAAAAAALRDAGIPGIRYLDQGSRGAGEGTHNYVVFDANTIYILRKYGLAGLIAGGGAAAARTQQQQPPTQ